MTRTSKIALRVIAFLLGALLLLFVVLAILSASINKQAIKDRVAMMVYDNTGFYLTLQGPIDLKIFPTLALQGSGLSLGTSSADKSFASVKTVRASVAWLPLLHRQIVVRSVLVDGLMVDMSAPMPASSSAAKMQGKPANKNDASGNSPFQLDIQDVELKDVTVLYPLANGEIRLTQFNLVSHAPMSNKGTINMDGRLQVKPQNLEVRLKFSSKLNLVLSPLAANLTHAQLELSEVNHKFSWHGDVMAKENEGKLQGTLNYQGSPGKISADFVTKPATLVNVDVALDRLVIEAATKTNSAASAATNEPVKAKNAPSFPRKSTSTPAQDKPSLTVKGHVAVGELVAPQTTLTNLVADVIYKPGSYELKKYTAQAFGGHLSGVAKFEEAGSKLKFSQEMKSVDLAALLKAANIKAPLAGSADFSTSLASTGSELNQIIDNLSGQGKFSLANGNITGVNLTGLIKEGRDLLANPARLQDYLGGAQSTTAFSSLGGSFRIKQGNMTNDDLDGRLPDDVRLTGKGNVNLGKKELDYVLKIEKMGKGAIPVSVSGPLAQPNIHVQWKDAAGSQIKSTIKNEAQNYLDKNPDKVDKLKDKLNNLLKR